ncbi:transcriptional repressor [Alkalicaulis satelles]|uniref:Transcriptional repressor n=1 Tax=Alkalicaulis satelles TaxID=2609175 RepID=A0A5M6ZI42_9PROT|nr:transcriptional repressor [Alkalicaulis satelles]KAA5803367.1 transcriptional repressor [Alkalicaulis satelles]
MTEEVTRALTAAERACRTKGLALTPVRRRVLQLLLESPAPVKAYDLLASLKPDGGAQPPTVYRALDFLTRAGLAHRIEALNAYTACVHVGGRGSAELYICEACGLVEERHRHRAPEDGPDGFHINRSVVEHYGRCSACATAQASA